MFYLICFGLVAASCMKLVFTWDDPDDVYTCHHDNRSQVSPLPVTPQPRADGNGDDT